LSDSSKQKKDWWHGAVVYQVYPRSFLDSDGDGIGDLRGIINKLDYLAGGAGSLGVDAIWISPFYSSPMADFGYDIADYYTVDAVFGTNEDFDELLKQAHERDIRVVVDFVPNHTSSQHPWFLESRSSKDNPKRDWYTWRDGRPEGGAPNNWESPFGESVWELDALTGQYYLHTFLKQQPDLNWDNPEVRRAMHEVAKFWLDKGADGLRVDAVSWLSKDPEFKDDLPNPHYVAGKDDPYSALLHNFSVRGPRLFDYLNELAELCASYGNRFMFTEAYPEVKGDISLYLKYYENLRYDICAPMNFEFISLPWEAQAYKEFIDSFQEALLPGQTPIYNMGNHDQPRLASRIGPEAARTAAMLLLMLPGMAFIYYGDELGMTNSALPADKLQDPFVGVDGSSRDIARTPMQWSSENNTGFSASEPWLPVTPNYVDLNVGSERGDHKSLLNLYKALLKIHNDSDAAKHGSYRSLDVGPDVYAFVRENEDQRITTVLNFSDKNVDVPSTALKGSLLLSTYLDNGSAEVHDDVKLRPYEGIIILSD